MILLKKAMKKTNQYRTRGSAILFCISLSFSRFHEDGSMSPSSCFCSKDSSYGAPCLWYCSRIWERNLWINQKTNQLSVLIYFYQWRAQFPMNYLKRLFALCQSFTVDVYTVLLQSIFKNWNFWNIHDQVFTFIPILKINIQTTI